MHVLYRLHIDNVGHESIDDEGCSNANQYSELVNIFLVAYSVYSSNWSLGREGKFLSILPNSELYIVLHLFLKVTWCMGVQGEIIKLYECLKISLQFYS